MTSNFKDFLKGGESQTEAPRPVVIDGCFDCAFCSLSVEMASWYPTLNALRFVCDEGHENLLTEFKL